MTWRQVSALFASHATQNACPVVAISAEILGDFPAGVTQLDVVLPRPFASDGILGRASTFKLAVVVLRLCMRLCVLRCPRVRLCVLRCPRMVSVVMKVGASVFSMDT